MLSARLRARLGELHRAAPAPAPSDPIEGPAPPAPARNLSPSATEPEGDIVARQDRQIRVHAAHPSRRLDLDGREVMTDAGSHWLIQQPLSQWWPSGERRLQALRNQPLLRHVEQPHLELTQLAQVFPDRCLFLDLETCGFAGSTVFLVGLLESKDGRIVLTQLLARDFSEEKAMLASLWQRVPDHSVLVTFNGKSFDWPVVQDRTTLHRMPHRSELHHCDLLHHCRRRYKTRLPDCRLQTLERHLCGRRRRGDIPGRDIPGVYSDFVRTGRTTQLRNVLKHNALDLVTLLQLSVLMLREEEL